MIRLIWVVLVMAGCVSVAAQAEVYRWVDDQGNTHFSDEPLDARAEAIEIRPVQTMRFVTTGEIEYADIPTRPSGAALVMYSTQRCGYCKRARRYFQQEGIAFVEKDIEQSEQARNEFNRLGGQGVPLLVRGRKTMSGFSVENFRRWYRQG